MSRLTLVWRIVVFTASAHVLVAIAGAGVMLVNAKAAVQEEIVAAQDSAVTLIERLAASLLLQTPDDAALSDLAAQIAQPRHVSILIVPRDSTLGTDLRPEDTLSDTDDEKAPDWFLALVTPSVDTVAVPLWASGELIGTAEISALPSDEAQEVWEDVQGLFVVWCLATIAMLVVVAVAISRALSPVRKLEIALAHLQDGDFSVRAADTGGPDLHPIGKGIDRLAYSLRTAEEARANLSKQVMHLRDAERKTLARELHDELGPCLFGLTVELDGMRQDLSAAPEGIDAMERLIDRIRATNARILNTLRPQTVGHLSLVDVLLDLLAEFEHQYPEVAIESHLDYVTPPTDETRDLTIYRIVQESVHNALRHGGAARVCVSLNTRDAERLVITVRDYGSGLAPDWREGRGLFGMRERVSALGGSLSIANASEGGASVTAEIPLQSQVEAGPRQSMSLERAS